MVLRQEWAPHRTLQEELANAAITEDGRERLRKEVLDGDGRAIITSNDPRYTHFRLDFLYRDIPLTVNGKVVTFRDGADGRTYYLEGAKKRAIWRTGDIILPYIRNSVSPETLNPYFDFTPEERLRLEGYSKRYHGIEGVHDHNILNRTFEHRLEDHEIFLRDLFAGEKDGKIHALQRRLFSGAKKKAVFFDIGPGIANKDLILNNGEGKPAITLQEIAEAFPSLPCIAVDRPDEVDIFVGKVSHEHVGYSIDHHARQEFLSKKNLHIISGDGLASLKSQLQDSRKNPYPDRLRPSIDQGTVILIRAANSIDIYCDWKAQIQPALIRMAEDFHDQSVVLLFNREIMLKLPSSTQWKIIGRVSPRGFRHNDRSLSRRGVEPYILK